MSNPDSPAQIRYGRVLIRSTNVDPDVEYLGAWAAKYGLTGAGRRGKLDDIDSRVASKLIDALRGAKK